MPDKELMGCKWTAFHTRVRKRKKSKSKFLEDEDEGYEAMLFATEGLDLPRITVHELLNWFMPIKLNYEQSSCKAFARLELGVSDRCSSVLMIRKSMLIFVSGLTKTYATVVLKPSQVRWSKDIRANGEPENHEYRDRSLSEKCVSDHHDLVNPHVMNDVSWEM